MKNSTLFLLFLCTIHITIAQHRPNILLFMADDMSWRDCQPYGNPDVITPHIQRLADEGMCMDNMFTATAMCSPTRQQLYTGIFPVRNGAYPNHSLVYNGVKSLGHHFRELGYRVVLAGKTHYGPPEAFPIEHLPGRNHDNGKNDKDINIKEIKSVIDGEEPFFIIIAENQPHTPWNRGNPSAYNPEHLTIPPYAVDLPETREALTHYYAEITYADSLLGECLTLLDDAGKADETITIFTSEQGYGLPFGKWTCYDLGLKTAFITRWPGHIEAGSRQDALVQYVDVVPTLLEVVGKDPEKIDVGIADTHGQRGFDGRSFWSVLQQNANEHRSYVYGIHTTRGIHNGSSSYPIRSIRDKRYKYIRNLNFEAPFFNNANTRKGELYHRWIETTQGTKEGEKIRTYMYRPYEELYDVENDPYEQHNLAELSDYAAVKQSLGKEMDQWMIQQGDLGVITEMNALSRQRKRNNPWQAYKEQR